MNRFFAAGLAFALFMSPVVAAHGEEAVRWLAPPEQEGEAGARGDLVLLLKFSPDGQRLLRQQGERLELWQVAAWRREAALPASPWPLPQWLPDGGVVFRQERGMALLAEERHRLLPAGTLAVSGDGRYTMLRRQSGEGSGAGERVVELASGRTVCAFPDAGTAPAGAAFGGAYAAVGAQRAGGFNLCDLSRGVATRVPIPGAGATNVILDPAGRWLLAQVTWQSAFFRSHEWQLYPLPLAGDVPAAAGDDPYCRQAGCVAPIPEVFPARDGVLEVSPDGGWLVQIVGGTRVLLYRMPTVQRVLEVDLPRPERGMLPRVSFSPGARGLLVQSQDQAYYADLQAATPAFSKIRLARQGMQLHAVADDGRHFLGTLPFREGAQSSGMWRLEVMSPRP